MNARKLGAVAAAFALATTGISPAAASDPAPTTAATYQMTATHEASQPGDNLMLPLGKSWTRAFGMGTVSYPLIAGGLGYVTVAHTQTYGTDLYALNLKTGTTAWGPVNLGGDYYIAGIAYDNGKVFAVTFGGLLRAFDATNGTLVWQRQMPNQYAFTSPPTAINGKVYLGGAGSGGTVYAVGQADGQVLWTAPVENGDHSGPAVTATGVYVSYACNQAYAFNPNSGAQLWHHTSNCEGSGGKTVAVHNGRVYTRDLDSNLVLDAKTGKEVGTYPSDTIPAFDGTVAYYLNSGKLSAVDSAGKTHWMFTGDGALTSAPIIDNGHVYVASSKGNVYAVDERTGRAAWTGNVGTAVGAPNEHSAQQLVGLAAAQGHLLVPAGGTLTGYVGIADFTMRTPARMPIKAGGDAVATVTLTADPRLNGTITLALSDVPSTSRASLQPGTVTLAPNQTGTTHLHVHASLLQFRSFTMTVTACFRSVCHSAPVQVQASVL